MLDLLRKTGAPALAFGLVCSMLLWYLILVNAGALKPGWQALDLTVFRLWGLLLLLSLFAGLIHTLRRRAIVQFCLYLAGLFLLLATAYAYLFHFEGALSLAEGENYEPFPISFSSGHKGRLAPFPQASFTLTRVEPDGKKGRAVIVERGVGTEIDGEWQTIGSSEIRFKGAALAPLIVVSGKEKGELERSYVKVDLSQGEQVVEFETLPYQFFLRREKPKGDGKELFHLEVRRGKLSLFEGSARLGQKISVQGVEVSIDDQRKFALLEMRSRRGGVVMQAAAAIFALATAAMVVRLTRGGKESPPP